MADLGQVFTKGNVARYMVSLFDLPKQAAIMDPCYGAGSFLDALLEYEYNNVTACEMDTTLFENTKAKYQQYRLINGDFLKYSDSNAYDGIIMNPPTIITTNLSFETIENTKEMEYQRIYSRIIEMCIPVVVLGQDYRKKIKSHKIKRHANSLLFGGEER